MSPQKSLTFCHFLKLFSELKRQESVFTGSRALKQFEAADADIAKENTAPVHWASESCVSDKLKGRGSNPYCVTKISVS